MKYDIKEITNGSHDGLIVYVSDIRSNDKPFAKFVRNIKPIKVIISSNNDLASNQRVNYSHSHFKKLNKNGAPLKSSIIKVYDNTGYRSYPGIELNVFDNMDECVLHYNNQVQVIRDEMKKFIEGYQSQYELFNQEV